MDGAATKRAIFRSGKQSDKGRVMTAIAAFAILTPALPSAADRYYLDAVETG